MKLNKYFIELNLAVLCISTSGIFGRLITLSPEVAIFWRCVFAAVILGLFIKVVKYELRIKSKSDFRVIILGGILMGLHWVTYFYALSLSNIAIAILTLHAFPAMTAILEPIILKTKFRLYHLVLALLVITGVWIILPSTDFSDNIVAAILFGLFSAFTYALRNIYTRKIVPKYNGSVMMFYQLVVMSVMLVPFVFIYSSKELAVDWPFLSLLVLITTVIGHTLLAKNLKHYSATTVGLLSSIIPVYGILWGVLFLAEIPSTKTLLGGSLILASFLIESLQSAKGKTT